jgi:hypothetical protein
MNSLQTVCGIRCAAKVAPKARKEAAKALRERREAAKPRGKWLQEAQAAFNAYIRKRDEAMPCISCGRFHEGQWHAGHYLSTGARPELRFDEQNCHKQCQPCNTHLHGNLVMYRAELIRRIGLAKVEKLEGPHQLCKWTVTDLKAIRDDYRAKGKAL